MDNFQIRLKQTMFMKGVRQIDLANKTGIDRTKICSYIKGRYKPNADSITKIANALGVTPSYLLGKEDISPAKMTIPSFHEVPVIGKVAAGVPINAQTDVIGTVTTDKDVFALKIKGDSMSPRIMDGDVVLVRQQNYAEDGDLVIVEIEGDATCKVIKKNAYGITLIPFNAAYPPFVYSNAQAEENLHILGRVVESRHEW